MNKRRELAEDGSSGKKLEKGNEASNYKSSLENETSSLIEREKR